MNPSTALVLALSFGSSAAADETSQPERLPNFILIVADNLGYGDIGPFGSKVHQTPHLDRMAAEGTRFTHFYVTAGVCTPSRASFLTGCYAQRVGLGYTEPDRHVLRPVSPNGLHPNEITVAEVLKQKGYATTILGKWHLGDQPPFLPTRQGFDSYLGIPYSDDMTADKRPPGEWPPLPLMEDERVIDAPVDRNLLTKRYTERALAYIEANRDRPFFLYFPQAMPGSTSKPFASEAFRGRSANGPWGDSVEELDWSAGQVLDKLRKLGIGRNTLVVWTSDNGAPTTGKPGDPSRGSNLPLYGRGYTTAEGAFRVPTIFWWPGRVPAGSVCREMATSMDLLPTFAHLAGAKPPDDRTIDGKDIRPLLLFGQPGAKTPYEEFYYYYCDQLQAVRSGPWKLFVPLEQPQRHPHHRGGGPSPTKLFNVVDDVGCRKNVVDDRPDVVRRLLKIADAARADLGDAGAPGPGRRPVGRFENPTARILQP
ncbi:MAG: sulfatase family protein [Planctomycetota bacterium]|jgi:arylsulfatase A-like enzyme